MKRERLKSSFQMFRSWLKKYHVFKWGIFISLACCIVMSVYLLYLAKTTDVKALKLSMEQATVVYDRTGEKAGELSQQKGTYVPLENISTFVVDAVLSTEDRRFYEHSGIDYMGIGRSVVNFFVNGFQISGGGSTLSQQLAKNAYLTQQQTLIRKAQELFLALEIERTYSKDDILAMYLNHAYFGQGVWGVEDASLKYFGVSASQLDISQAAVLAGILKSPSYYNPIANKEQSKHRRDVVLNLMVENEKLSEEQAQQEKAKDIYLQDNYNKFLNYQYPYFFDTVIAQAQQLYGISDEDLMTKGYQVYTTLDQNYQRQLDWAYANDTLFPDASDGTLVQSATVIADAKTGGLMAIVGGRGDYTYQGFNRVTQMKRQPGSVLKPLVVYTPALENGYQIDSVVLDEEKSYGSDRYTPTNWNKVSVGSLPLYQALAESKNTSAVWLLDKLGLQVGLDKLNTFGITTTKDDAYLGIALGGMTEGTTPLAINTAYTAFANNGVRQDPYVITKIVDASGNVIVDKTYTGTQRVMNEQVSSDMTKMMLGVFEPGGTGYVPLNVPSQIAGKTGTTELKGQTGAQDQWVVAYTPDFVMTTWMGFDYTDSTHKLGLTYDESIKPFFGYAINQILAVSPQTLFNVQSIQSEKAQQQLQEVDWFNQTVDTLKDWSTQLGEGAQDILRQFTNIFKKE